MNHVNILVVDDEPSILGWIQMLLRRKLNINGNCTFLEAMDGEEALEIVASNDVDLIITDIAMPRMNGIQLIRKLVQEVEYPPERIMILTAMSPTRTVTSAIKRMGLAASSYLEKIHTSLAVSIVKTRIQELELDIIGELATA